MSLIINVPDTLRAQVEAASLGLNTVLYTAKGQPCFMRVVPLTANSALDAGLGAGNHPAFTVGGVEKSALYLGLYPGKVLNGELVSQPGVDPSHSINHDNFVAYARANGTGWHLMSNIEWALQGAICYKSGLQPRGNNNYGRDNVETSEVGRRQDKLTPGTASGDARTLTGSGPLSWRHDYTPYGIADLNGNVWEWSPGLRLNAGEINVIENNDAALNATDMAAGSAAWKAIDGSDGSLVAPGSANTVKIAASGTAAYTLVVGSGAAFSGMTNPGSTPVHADALVVLKRHGIYPLASTGLGGDYIYHNLTGERLPRRGGAWNSAAGAGVFAVSLNYGRTSPSTDVGARPAFVA